MTALTNSWPQSSSSYLHPEDPQRVASGRLSDRVSRSLTISHRSSRSHNSNKPFRPDYHRSYSSDPFVSPLEKIKQEHKAAYRAPHLKRVIPTDTIDSLDATALVGGPYHHEGPYDATLASRQIPGRAPVEAVKYGNAAALAATPAANIVDSLTRKRPLQGIGMIAPGYTGPGGQTFEYVEEDLMRKEGKLGRWPGVEYDERDIKGKGEPGFSQDEREKSLKAMRKQQLYDSVHGAGAIGDAIQMQNQPTGGSVSDAARYTPLYNEQDNQAVSSGIGRLGSLKKKFSLRRRKSKA